MPLPTPNPTQHIGHDHAQLLLGLSQSPDHWSVLRHIRLTSCGAAFTSLEVLATAPALETIEITGANNIRAPWDAKSECRGFDSLQSITLNDIASLCDYKSWISDPNGKRRPILTIGAVYLPNGVDEIELGHHVRFRQTDFAFAKEHWLRLAPAYIDFTNAIERRDKKFRVPAKCSAPLLMAVLGEESSFVEVDCRECEGVCGWLPEAWLPAKLGMASDAPDGGIKIILPNPARLRSKGNDVSGECDKFVSLLRQLSAGRAVQVKIEGAVAGRLQAWKWYLEATSSALRLELSPPESGKSPLGPNGFELDLTQPMHKDLCQLLVTHPEHDLNFTSVCVVGGIASSQIAPLRALLEAWPNLKLHLEVKCHGGAEFALVNFVIDFENRVSISEELTAQFEELDFERQEYERAARWAEDGGAR